MKKILFAIGSMGHGGTESQLLHLIRALDKKKFSISVYLMESKGQLLDELKSLNVKLYEGKFVPNKFKPISYLSFIKSFLYLLWILSTNRFYLIQSYLPMVNFFSVIAGKLTFHKIWTGWRGMTFHQVKKPYLNTFDSISNLLSDGINANAHAILKDKLNKEKFLSYKKSTVIRNYIPIENFRRITDEAKEYERKKFNVNNEDILLLCVSNLIPYKGHMDLLEALKLLPEKFKLTIAGRDDGLWSNLEEFIVSNDLQNRVNYLGYCNKEKLNILYQISDIYVSPSHTEGISNSIIEALIHELRVVATDAGGNAELLEDGKLGFICEASNPEDLAKKITAASKKLENISYGKDYIYRKYSKENMLNCYLKSWKI